MLYELAAFFGCFAIDFALVSEFHSLSSFFILTLAVGASIQILDSLLYTLAVTTLFLLALRREIVTGTFTVVYSRPGVHFEQFISWLYGFLCKWRCRWPSICKRLPSLYSILFSDSGGRRKFQATIRSFKPRKAAKAVPPGKTFSRFEAPDFEEEEFVSSPLYRNPKRSLSDTSAFLDDGTVADDRPEEEREDGREEADEQEDTQDAETDQREEEQDGSEDDPDFVPHDRPEEEEEEEENQQEHDSGSSDSSGDGSFGDDGNGGGGDGGGDDGFDEESEDENEAEAGGDGGALWDDEDDEEITAHTQIHDDSAPDTETPYESSGDNQEKKQPLDHQPPSDQPDDLDEQGGDVYEDEDNQGEDGDQGPEEEAQRDPDQDGFVEDASDDEEEL